MAAGPLVQFFEVVRDDGSPLDPALDWVKCMRHVASMSPANRMQTVGGRRRLGEVWSDGPSTQSRDATKFVFTCSAQRLFRPGEADWAAGRTDAAPMRRGRGYVERVVATCVRPNVIGLVRFGNSAPRHSSVIEYVNVACKFKPPLRFRPIPRPSVLEQLNRTGSIARKIEFTATMSGLRRIVGQRSPLFRLTSNARGNLDRTRLTVTYQLDTKKRTRKKMGRQVVEEGRDLMQDAQALGHHLGDVERGTIVLIDENDERHEIDLAEVKLTVQWPGRRTTATDYLPPGEVRDEILNAYSQVNDHINEVVSH